MKTRNISLSFEIDSVSLIKKLHIREGTQAERTVLNLVREGWPCLKPQGVYGEASVFIEQEEKVVMDKTPFSSRILQCNLARNNKVYPFLLTCGSQADEWIASKEDNLEHYWADAIAEEVLQLALTNLLAMVQEIYQLDDVAMMNPGALDWSIEDQKHLFCLFGEDTAGIKLTEDCLMIPMKTLSGVFFEDDNQFVNCRLCPEIRCEHRRAKMSQC